MTRRYLALLVLSTLVAAPLAAGAAPTPRLALGRARLRPDGSARIPVFLKTRRTDGVAAFTFTLQAPGLRLTGATRALALTRAQARLETHVEDDGSGLAAVVVPKFGLPLPVLRRGRVATVHLRGETSPRRIRRALGLAQVTFADISGQVVHPQGSAATAPAPSPPIAGHSP